MLSKEQCTGDPAKRTGNEYMFQELANANIEDLKAAGPKKILTSCPHCVKTIGDDYRQFGYEVEIVHSSVFVEELMRDDRRRATAVAERRETVTFHDPCYLGRYAGKVDEPRALLDAVRRATSTSRCATATIRTAAAPAAGCCSPTRKRSRARRISDVRFKQLQDTGADTVVTACPFCSIMLKGAQASAPAGATSSSST